MAKLTLALILVICVQVVTPMKITVPDEFNGILGKCDLALDEKRKVEKADLPVKGTIDTCAAACSKDDRCASVQFTGTYDGNDGQCVYSSFICVAANWISNEISDTTFQVYITKGEEAWKKSAQSSIVSENQIQPWKNQTIYYQEGCCTIDKDFFCAHDQGDAEEAGSDIASTDDCYNACVADPACVSYRIKWKVPSDLLDETGICFKSLHACSFTANNQTDRLSEDRSEALTYVLVQRLKSNQMTGGKGEIDVGGVSITTTAASTPDTSTAPTMPTTPALPDTSTTTPTTPAMPDTSTAQTMPTPQAQTSGSGRAAAAIVAVALASGILALATKSIV